MPYMTNDQQDRLPVVSRNWPLKVAAGGIAVALLMIPLMILASLLAGAIVMAIIALALGSFMAAAIRHRRRR